MNNQWNEEGQILALSKPNAECSLRSVDGLMNKQLEALYTIFWNKHKADIKRHEMLGHEIACPWFLAVDEEAIEKSLLKVMIFGNEDTNYWGSQLRISELSPSSLMQLYTQVLDDWGDNNKQWWQFFNNLRGWSNVYAADSFYFISNTLTKIARQGGIGTDKEVFDHLIDDSNLVFSELQIIQPDVLIFLQNNPGYDYYIERTIGKFDTEPTAMDRVYRLHFHDSDIPALRLDHPLYLNITRRFGDALEFIKEFLIEQLRFYYK